MRFTKAKIISWPVRGHNGMCLRLDYRMQATGIRPLIPEVIQTRTPYSVQRAKIFSDRTQTHSQRHVLSLFRKKATTSCIVLFIYSACFLVHRHILFNIVYCKVRKYTLPYGKCTIMQQHIIAANQSFASVYTHKKRYLKECL